MQSSIIVAIISSATAVLVAACSYLFAKRREREAEWRKLMLEHYREYFSAMSGFTESRSTPDSMARYLDASNALLLIAPIEVIRALQAFHAINSQPKENRVDRHYDKVLSELIRTIRRSIQPMSQNDADVEFRLIGVLRDNQSN